MPKIATITLDKNGEYPSHAWPGGYPIIYANRDCEVLCPDCANTMGENGWKLFAPTRFDVFYEGPSLSCDACNVEIESAYGDPQEEEEEASLNRYVSELARTYDAKGGK